MKHSDDEAREARYLHRTWRKPDGGFYVGVEPPQNSEALGIVSMGPFDRPEQALTMNAVLSARRHFGWLCHAQWLLDHEPQRCRLGRDRANDGRRFMVA